MRGGAVFVEECRFLLVAVPPLAILVVLTIIGISYTRIIQVIVFTGVLSLGVWGGVAGRRAGLSRWALMLSIASGLLLGASSWRFRRCSSPSISPSVHNRRGLAQAGRAFGKRIAVSNVGGGPHFGAELTIDTAAELHADGFSAR